MEITCNLLHNSMTSSDKKKFLIDGFPRNRNNVDGWESTVAKSVDLQFVLFFECPREVLSLQYLR